MAILQHFPVTLSGSNDSLLELLNGSIKSQERYGCASQELLATENNIENVNIQVNTSKHLLNVSEYSFLEKDENLHVTVVESFEPLDAHASGDRDYQINKIQFKNMSNVSSGDNIKVNKKKKRKQESFDSVNLISIKKGKLDEEACHEQMFNKKVSGIKIKKKNKHKVQDNVIQEQYNTGYIENEHNNIIYETVSDSSLQKVLHQKRKPKHRDNDNSESDNKKDAGKQYLGDDHQFNINHNKSDENELGENMEISKKEKPKHGKHGITSESMNNDSSWNKNKKRKKHKMQNDSSSEIITAPTETTVQGSAVQKQFNATFVENEHNSDVHQAASDSFVKKIEHKRKHKHKDNANSKLDDKNAGKQEIANDQWNNLSNNKSDRKELMKTSKKKTTKYEIHEIMYDSMSIGNSWKKINKKSKKDKIQNDNCSEISSAATETTVKQEHLSSSNKYNLDEARKSPKRKEHKKSKKVISENELTKGNNLSINVADKKLTDDQQISHCANIKASCNKFSESKLDTMKEKKKKLKRGELQMDKSLHSSDFEKQNICSQGNKSTLVGETTFMEKNKLSSTTIPEDGERRLKNNKINKNNLDAENKKSQVHNQVEQETQSPILAGSYYKKKRIKDTLAHDELSKSVDLEKSCLDLSPNSRDESFHETLKNTTKDNLKVKLNASLIYSTSSGESDSESDVKPRNQGSSSLHSKSSLFIDINSSDMEDADVIKEAVGEAFDKKRLSVDDLNILHNLTVLISWKIPDSHKIETRMSSGPNESQKRQFEQLDLKIKKGPYTKQEDDTINANWKEFCKVHDLNPDPTPFLAFTIDKKNNALKPSERIQFVRYLGKNLEHRMLHSIYRRFQTLFKTRIKGRFTTKEDYIILTHMNTSKSHNRISDLATLLNRTRNAIANRYTTLSSQSKHVSWSMDLMQSLLENIMLVTRKEIIEELKDYPITLEEWQKVEAEMNISYKNLRKKWERELHPRLFCKELNTLNEVREKLINILTDLPEYDRRSIDWKQLALKFDGFTGSKLYKIFVDLLQVYVPENKRNDFKASLECLRNTAKIEGKIRRMSKLQYTNGILINVLE